MLAWDGAYPQEHDCYVCLSLPRGRLAQRQHTKKDRSLPTSTPLPPSPPHHAWHRPPQNSTTPVAQALYSCTRTTPISPRRPPPPPPMLRCVTPPPHRPFLAPAHLLVVADLLNQLLHGHLFPVLVEVPLRRHPSVVHQEVRIRSEARHHAGRVLVQPGLCWIGGLIGGWGEKKACRGRCERGPGAKGAGVCVVLCVC